MPRFFFASSARQHLIENLEQVFETVRNQYSLSEGDMPDVNDFRERLAASFEDFRTFPVLDPKDLDDLEEILSDALPAIMLGASQIGKNEEEEEEPQQHHKVEHPIKETGNSRSQDKVSADASVDQAAINKGMPVVKPKLTTGVIQNLVRESFMECILPNVSFEIYTHNKSFMNQFCLFVPPFLIFQRRNWTLWELSPWPFKS